MHLFPLRVLSVAALLLSTLPCPAQKETAEPAAKPAAATKATGTVLVYDLAGPMTDVPGDVSPLQLLMQGGTDAAPSLFELLQALQKAGKDKGVAAVVLLLDEMGANTAQTEEIRGAILRIKAAGKPVWAFTQSLSMKSLWLGSAASRLVLMPTSDVGLYGIGMDRMYFKDALDKIGVQFETITAGDFKDAGEMFTRTGPSDYSTLQTNELLDGLNNLILGDIATGRGKTPAEIQTLIDRGTLTPRQALDEKLVDTLMYRNEFTAEVRRQLGRKINYTYGLEEKEGFSLNLSLLFGGGPSAGLRAPGKSVAVIALEGGIDDKSIRVARREILRAARDRTVGALVFRVSSGGGSALASDVLYEATRVFKKTGKPLIISMGEAAASGGYYISAQGDHVFADRATITGSIGVFMSKMVLKDLIARVGVNISPLHRGRHAGLMSPFKSITPEEAEILRADCAHWYATFKNAILEGRRDRLKKDLDAIAGGRVYTGLPALELGLVDGIGGLREAITLAAEKAGLPAGCEVRLRPEKKDFFASLEELFGPKKPDEDFISLRRDSPSDLFAALVDPIHLTLLRRVDPALAAAFQRLLGELRILQTERVILSSPYLIPRF